MRLLIAGWQGQVARALAQAAPGCADITACALGRPALDICEMKTITRALSQNTPDVVINTAAYTAVDQAETDSEAAFALNRDGARALAQAAAARGAAIIHLSTDYVFDGNKQGAYVEDDPIRPATVYGHSKAAGEQAVRENNARHIILRTSWVYSPYGKNFVKTMLQLSRTRSDIAVVDDQIGCPTYAPHLAKAILEIARQICLGKDADNQDVPWGTYHIAGTGTASWCALAREALACSKNAGGPSANIRAISTAEYPTPARRPANSRLDCDKLSRNFDVRLPPWRQGVEDCIAQLTAGEL